jgi:hypothetical protein
MEISEKGSLTNNPNVETARSLGNNEIDPSFEIYFAKIENEGEDAPPTSKIFSDIFWLGVYDGMGGSGSEEYCLIETREKHSSAYFGSRIIKKFIEDKLSEAPNRYFNDSDVLDLGNELKVELQKSIDNYELSGSRIVSKLKRKFPSTMALAGINKNLGELKVIWAGDSRVYLLNQCGLKQLTKDDIAINHNDRYENENVLDAPLNNFISADVPFILNQDMISIKSETNVIFAVTDGCFAYYKTPLHFEYAIFKTLFDSESIDEWREKIKKEFNKVTGDDFSMALLILGGNIETLKVVVKSFFENIRSRFSLFDNNYSPFQELNQNCDHPLPIENTHTLKDINELTE